jgi:VIT1/CCC1 family predicted Fe2+/Mn2+ transporter
MPFVSSDLAVLSNARGVTTWSYITPDTPATVVASGYFSDARDRLRRNDRIVVIASSTGAAIPLTVTVSSATGASPVTVASVPVATALTAAGTGATAGAYASAAIRDERDARIALHDQVLIAAGLMRAP